MSALSLELGPEVKDLVCECCGKNVHRVFGFISRDEQAYGVYFALLNHHDGDHRIVLSMSIGDWWNDDPADIATRRWCVLHIRSSEDNWATRIGEPEESNHFPWADGGKALSRSEMLACSDKDDFFAVSDFVVQQDPAVLSFLEGREIDSTGRTRNSIL